MSVIPSNLSYLFTAWCTLVATGLIASGCEDGERKSPSGQKRGPASAGATGKVLQLDPENPRYLLFRGKPTVLITSGEHYGAVLNGGFDFIPYLDELARAGLNQTRLFSGSFFDFPGSPAGIGDYDTLAPSPQQLIAPWQRNQSGQFDLSEWNPDYFDRLHDFVGAAAERGIVVEMTLFSAVYDYPRWEVSPFNAANNVQGVGSTDPSNLYTTDNDGALKFQDALTRKLVRELNRYDNVYYEVINEGWAEPAPAADPWEDHIISTIQGAEEDLPVQHLIARNYDEKEALSSKPNPAVSISNFHYRRNLSAYSDQLDGALALDETGLQGTAPAPYRADAWYFMLSGGAVYSNLDWSYANDYEDGSYDVPPDAPGGGGPRLRRQLGILARFLDGFDLVQMAPRADLITDKPEGSTVQVLAGRDDFAVYISRDQGGSLTMKLPSGTYRANWIDPVGGDVLRAETIQGGDAVTLTPPPHGLDVALALRRDGGDA